MFTMSYFKGLNIYFLLSASFILCLTLLPSLVFAQGGGPAPPAPPPPPPPPGVPIDGGVVGLLVAGIGYGVKKIYNRK